MPDISAFGDNLTVFTALAATIAALINLLRWRIPSLAGRERIISIAMGVILAGLAAQLGWMDIDFTLKSVVATGAGLAMGSGVAYDQIMRAFQKPAGSKTDKAIQEIRAELKANAR